MMWKNIAIYTGSHLSAQDTIQRHIQDFSKGGFQVKLWMYYWSSLTACLHQLSSSNLVESEQFPS